jgi:hypothetical protein
VADVPHFDLPLRFGPQAAVVEQDSVEEIAACVLAILLCRVGFRDELPEFGVPDFTFSNPVDVELIRAAVLEWEERASVLVEMSPDTFDALVERVQVQVQVRAEE